MPYSDGRCRRCHRLIRALDNCTQRSRRRNRNAPDYFVGRPGNGAWPILIFVKRPTCWRRFNLYGVANRVAETEFEPRLRRALARERERY
jgi:hypothetical protein